MFRFLENVGQSYVALKACIHCAASEVAKELDMVPSAISEPVYLFPGNRHRQGGV